ncbi:nickel pincer cofactor biosynthesis protein LarB [Magnetococcus sp. PR-3]|uniref:nickel pincer cofactor biosynthesis protein LarB n=1 Tax=Magnetococcus sp. PR-3 TaxID=3120355 RepID=UPI002FCE247E
MSPEQLKIILEQVSEGKLTVTDALTDLKHFPMDTIQNHGQIVARLDTHRELRHGFPEVILAQGKKFNHLHAITTRALTHGRDLLITRIGKKKAAKLLSHHPQLQHHPLPRCMTWQHDPKQQGTGLVAVLCAGTSDLAVAEEAALTARMLGATVETHYDAGVAGLHRLLAASDLLKRAQVFIVAAGMEGALPSVVGGLVDRPVIAVPTSQGYGASLGGMAALLGMLNSCASNVTTVNIDNGFGAGYVAALINRTGQTQQE